MKQISAPSKKRLVTLSRILSQIISQQNSSLKRITSVEISTITGWSEATIRRDISLLELHSGKSNGYNIEELRNSILEQLNIKSAVSEKINCCIVGLGKTGAAFLQKDIFSNSPFEIVAGFDSNENKIELLQSDFPLYLTSKMESVIKTNKIKYAILVVSDDVAQIFAERLAAYGIIGIVNYTRQILTLPANIKIENANPVFALTNLSNSL